MALRVVSEADAIQNLPALLRDAHGNPIVISDGENDLRVIVSMNDYEIVRKARIDRFLKAADAFGEEARAQAAEYGLSPEDVVKTLFSSATF